MKKIYTLLICGAAILLFAQQTQAQCNYTITTADSTLCLGDSTVLSTQGAADSLFTTLAAGNNHRGNMFDIVALNTVNITGFDAHPQANTTIEIYYKVGGFSGSENNAAAWTLVGSAAVIAQPLGTLTPVPVPVNIIIPAGQTYAFYVTSSNVAVSLNYTNGTVQGSVYSQDANIQFLEGVGLEYPFTGTAFSPRVWNGQIHYEVPLSYLWSTGATTSSITITPAADLDYWVTVTDALNACNNTDSILVTVATPPLVNLGADPVFCQGDSVTIDAGNPGLTYLWSTAATGQMITTSSSGAYFVDVTDASGCIGSDTLIVTVNVNMLNLGSDTTVCNGSSLTLDAGTGTNYLWSTSDVTQTINVTTPGTYSVNSTDLNSCLENDTINVMFIGPLADLGTDTTLCTGSTLLLDAGIADTYLWNTTDVTQTIMISTANTYSVTVTDTVSGCSSTDDIVVAIANVPVAGFTSTPTSLTVNFTNTSVDATSYIWDFGDGSGISTMMDPSYIYGMSGTYVVILIVNGPCGSDTTQLTVTVDNAGVDEQLFGQLINIYPNPTIGNLTINVESIQEGITVNILAMSGQLLTSNYYNESKTIETSIYEASGIYMVELITNSGKTKRFRIVKK